MHNWIKIGNITYDLPCSFRREPRMELSDVSGMLMDRTQFNDVIGVYMDYSVSVAVPVGSEDVYNSLFNQLCAALGEQKFTFPNGGAATEASAVLVTYGKVERLTDSFYDYTKLTRSGTTTYQTVWRNISFRIIATRPWKEGA